MNITAEKKESKEEKDETYTRREFQYNAFERSMELPENVKEEAIKARYNDGILSFKVLKKAPVAKKAPKVIEVG